MLEKDKYANSVALYIKGITDSAESSTATQSSTNTLTAISTTDEYSKFVSLLIKGTGSDGKNNNSFKNLINDESLIRFGNTTQGTFNPTSLSNGYWSYFFDGSSSLSIPHSSLFNIGRYFTIEMWIYPLAPSRNCTLIGRIATSNWVLNLGGSSISFWREYDRLGTGTSLVSGSTYSYSSLMNRWSHIVVNRTGTSGSNWNIYVNGVNAASANASALPYDRPNPVVIGSGFYGYISNIRIVNSAVYGTSGLTVPTRPLGILSNTALLTGQNNRFVDNSSNAHSMSPSGNVAVVPFTPFTPVIGDASISPGYWSNSFDGNDDYLTVSNTTTNFGTSNFTIEAWVKTNVVDTSVDTILSNYNTGVNGAMRLVINSGTSGGIQLYSGNTLVITAPSAIAANTWYHLAVVRLNSITYMYINGLLIKQASDTNNYGTDNTVTSIGANRTSGTYGNFLNGFVSNLRVVKGSAIYTTPFMMPTGALTAVSGTSLLTLQNSRIVDNSSNNFSITVAGNTKTTQTGPHSVSPNYSFSFNGSTNWLTLGGQTAFAFGTENFTIEFWYYSNNSGSQHVIYDSRPASTNGSYATILKSASNTINVLVNNSTAITGSSTIQKEIWYHVAVSRFNGVTRLFIDGDVDGSFTDSNNYLNGANRPIIGNEGFNTAAASKVNGFISNLRVLKGTAIYTSKFVPPSSALTATFGTSLLTAGTSNISDSSANAFTITNNGSTTSSTTNPFNGLYSLYFNGANEHAVINHSSAINILSSDFTVELWFQSDSQGAVTRTLAAQWSQQSASTAGWALQLNSTNNLLFQWGPHSNVNALITSSSVAVNGSWNHVAITRNESTFTMYLNGVSVGTATSSTTSSYLTVNTTIGNFYNSSGIIGATGVSYYKGFIASFRILDGVVAYTSSFTPSTSPLVVDAYKETTGLLMAQSNDGSDISGNNLVVTLTGTNIRVSQETPFSSTATWSSVNKTGVLLGGSTYFDGVGDYLSVPANDAFVPQTNEDFTIEFWTKLRSLPATEAVILSSGWPTIYCPYMFSWDGSSAIKFYSSSNGSSWDVANAVTVASNPKESIWYHFAVSRRNGVIRLFLNGNLVTSINSTAGLYRTALHPITLMANVSGTSPAGGFMAGLRVLRGAGLYTASFIPSTTPAETLASSSLHMNFRNAGVFDSTNQQIVETVGDASISTLQSRNGGSSIYFDGTDDQLYTENDELAWGTGDFTVQFWMRSDDVSSASQRGVMQTSTYNSAINSDLTTGLSLYQGLTVGGTPLNGALSGNLMGITFGTTTSVLTANTWTHIAIVRSSGSVTLYVNGAAVDMRTSAGYVSANKMSIGGYASPSNMYSGYIDDFKISTEASYTGNFTPV